MNKPIDKTFLKMFSLEVGMWLSQTVLAQLGESTELNTSALIGCDCASNNPSTWEVALGGSGVQGHPGYKSSLSPVLTIRKPCLRKDENFLFDLEGCSTLMSWSVCSFGLCCPVEAEPA